jgi:hypothetical protein
MFSQVIAFLSLLRISNRLVMKRTMLKKKKIHRITHSVDKSGSVSLKISSPDKNVGIE